MLTAAINFKQTFITVGICPLGFQLVHLLVVLVWVQLRLRQFHIPSSFKFTKCFKITVQSWLRVRGKAVHLHTHSL